MSKKETKITIESMPFHQPSKSYESDAAYNLFTNETKLVKSNTRMYINLGFKIALPSNMAMVIQPRSGQTGKGMIAYAEAPKWLGGDFFKLRINADAQVGLIDSNYGGWVQAIVKVGKLRLKHRILQLLGFKITIAANSCICQGRLVCVLDVDLVEGVVKGTRDGLGSTDK